ncbi:uncharacterized protein A4U43_C03F14740 [Asparagus officinalis]|uniref:Uncharacterized protein n=1 Tax=Asparagus officinalis TaxID=4686 RepID=A0A5P1FBV3_ASPOF|nr:uncharacterized protein A4U43_C03F14740 [Asparagus officinalis]
MLKGESWVAIFAEQSASGTKRSSSKNSDLNNQMTELTWEKGEVGREIVISAASILHQRIGHLERTEQRQSLLVYGPQPLIDLLRRKGEGLPSKCGRRKGLVFQDFLLTVCCTRRRTVICFLSSRSIEH